VPIVDPYSTDESSEHDMDVELVEPDSGCESQRVRDCIAACDRSQYCVNTYLSVHMVPLQDTLKSNATVLMARSEETCTICYGGLFDGRKAVVQLPCKCVDTTNFFCPRAFLPFLLMCPPSIIASGYLQAHVSQERHSKVAARFRHDRRSWPLSALF